MANTKITELTALTQCAATDVLPIVKVSANTTKKVSISDLLRNAPAGTATAPSIASADDQNTGILFPATESIGVSTAGTQRLLIDSSGNVGINNASPQYQLHVRSNSSASSQRIDLHMTNDTTGHGNGDGVQFGYQNVYGAYIWNFENTPIYFGTNNTERLRIDSSGRLLVGTTTATDNTRLDQKLGIVSNSASNGGIRITQNPGTNASVAPILDFRKSRGTTDGSHTIVANGDTLGYITFGGADGVDNESQAAFIFCQVDGTPGSNDMPGRLVFSTTADGSDSPTERMRIDSSGRVGIGTSSPGRQLQINGDSDTQIRVVASAGGAAGIQFGDANDSVMGGVNFDASDDSLQLRGFNNTERLRIDSSGNVGIDFTPKSMHANVTSSLNVGSSGLFQRTKNTFISSNFYYNSSDVGKSIASGHALIYFQDVTNGAHIWYRTGSASGADETVSNVESMRIDSSGRVGIGTTSPGKTLSVKGSSYGQAEIVGPTGSELYFVSSEGGSSNGTISYTHGSNYMNFYTAGSERMRIDSSGNVGIGHTSPASLFTVGGDVITTAKPTVSIAPSSGNGSITLRGGSPTLSFDQTGGGDGTIIYDSGSDLLFKNGTLDSSTEQMRIDSSGRLLVGTSSGNDSGSESNLIIESNSSGGSSYGGLMLRRGSTSIGSGSSLGRMYFADQNGNTGARISALGDGTWATDDYPGVLIFDTTADGASSPTERMRIDSSGNLILKTTASAGDFIFKEGSTNAWSIDTNGANGYLRFFDKYNNTERVRIDNSGKVGINETSPSARLHISAAYNETGLKVLGGAAGYSSPLIVGNASGTEYMRVDDDGRLLVGTSTARTDFYSGALSADIQLEDSSYCAYSAYAVNGNAAFIFGRGNPTSGSVVGNLSWMADDGTDEVETARISAQIDGTPGSNDMPGRLVFSTTADGASSTTEALRIKSNQQSIFSGSQYVLYALSENGSSSAVALFTGRHSATIGNNSSGTEAIRIYTSGTIKNATGTYDQLSDERLKENIVDATSQWDDIKNLRIRKFNFAENTGHPTHTQIGLVAQEAEQICPGLVEENETEEGAACPDKDGNQLDSTKAVHQSVLYMKAVKALQEAMDRIETLEAKVAALEAQ